MASSAAEVTISRSDNTFAASYLGPIKGGHQIQLTSSTRSAVKMVIAAGSSAQTGSFSCDLLVPTTNLKCTAAYAHRKLLNDHRDLFHSLRPYECRNCERLFSDASGLRKHTCKSTGVRGGKKYACTHPGCPKEVTPMRSDNMKRHDDTFHGGQKAYKDFVPPSTNGAQKAVSTINTNKRPRENNDDIVRSPDPKRQRHAQAGYAPVNQRLDTMNIASSSTTHGSAMYINYNVDVDQTNVVPADRNNFFAGALNNMASSTHHIDNQTTSYPHPPYTEASNVDFGFSGLSLDSAAPQAPSPHRGLPNFNFSDAPSAQIDEIDPGAADFGDGVQQAPVPFVNIQQLDRSFPLQPQEVEANASDAILGASELQASSSVEESSEQAGIDLSTIDHNGINWSSLEDSGYDTSSEHGWWDECATGVLPSARAIQT